MTHWKRDADALGIDTALAASMPEQVVIPEEDADLYIYWCPKCQRQIEKPWHTIKGNPLFPQTDDEHYGVRVKVVVA